MKVEARYEYGVLTLHRVFDSLEEERNCRSDKEQEDIWCSQMDYETCMTCVGECRVPRHIQMEIVDMRPREQEPMDDGDIDDIPF